MKRSGPVDASGVALLVSGTVVVGTLALTEQFALVPPAVVAYAVSWWLWGLDAPQPRTSEEENP